MDEFKIENGELLKYNGSSENIIVPDGVTSIGVGTFMEHTDLTCIQLPASVTEIKEDAFLKCKNLKSINLPNGLKYIGGYAFYGCSSLTYLEFPQTLEQIERHAFNRCSGLKSAVIPDSVTFISNSIFYKCSSLQMVKLPNFIKKIGAFEFYECTSLKEIIIPDSVVRIENDVFSGCRSLEYVKMSDNIEWINSRPFARCPNLKIIEFRGFRIETESISDSNDACSIIKYGYSGVGTSKVKYQVALQKYVKNKDEESCEYLKKNIKRVFNYFNNKGDKKSIEIIRKFADENNIADKIDS